MTAAPPRHARVPPQGPRRPTLRPPGEVPGPPLGLPPPARSAWEWLLWLVTGAVAAVALTWPLARHLSTSVPQDTGDPLAQAWHVAWGGHALVESPLRLFQGNVFWPAESSYAFSDTLLGYAPAALLGDGVVAAVTRYNLLFLFSFALAFAATALLARELGCRPAAAAVAGFAYAWAPWKLSHTGHLNVLSTGGVPLTLFLLVSGYRRGRPWQVVAGWVAAAWQISLGFALGIWFAYLLAALAALTAAAWLWHGRPRLPRALVTSTAVGVAVLVAVTAFMVRPYLEIVQRDAGALRDRASIEFFSAPVRSLLAAHPDSRAWGEATAVIRDTGLFIGEQTLFPGVTAVLLAVLGLRWRGTTRGLRVGLATATGFVLLLSFGLRLWDGVLYEPFLEYAPGWQGLRTTGRLAFLWSLGLALLAAFGAQRAADAVRRHRAAGGALALALAALVAYEGSPRLSLPQVPAPPPELVLAGEPRLHLPTDPFRDTTYMLWSTDGFPRIGNGAASYTPPTLTELREQVAGFPDRSSVEHLRRLGFRTVVLHRDAVPGTPWEGAADRPVDGLGITRTENDAVVVFDLT